MHISGHLATETKDIVNYHKIKLDLKEKQSYLKLVKKVYHFNVNYIHVASSNFMYTYV